MLPCRKGPKCVINLAYGDSHTLCCSFALTIVWKSAFYEKRRALLRYYCWKSWRLQNSGDELWVFFRQRTGLSFNKMVSHLPESSSTMADWLRICNVERNNVCSMMNNASHLVERGAVVGVALSIFLSFLRCSIVKYYRISYLCFSDPTWGCLARFGFVCFVCKFFLFFLHQVRIYYRDTQINGAKQRYNFASWNLSLPVRWCSHDWSHPRAAHCFESWLMINEPESCSHLFVREEEKAGFTKK